MLCIVNEYISPSSVVHFGSYYTTMRPHESIPRLSSSSLASPSGFMDVIRATNAAPCDLRATPPNRHKLSLHRRSSPLIAEARDALSAKSSHVCDNCNAGHQICSMWLIIPEHGAHNSPPCGSKFPLFGGIHTSLQGIVTVASGTPTQGIRRRLPMKCRQIGASHPVIAAARRTIYLPFSLRIARLRIQKAHRVPFGFAPRRKSVTSESASTSVSST